MIRYVFESMLHFVEFTVLAFIFIVMVSQIAVPLATNTPLFPILSRKPKLRKDINAVNEELEEQDLQEELERTKRTLDARRSYVKPNAPQPNPVPPRPADYIRKSTSAIKPRPPVVKTKTTRNS